MLVNRVGATGAAIKAVTGVDLSKFYSGAKVSEITVGPEMTELIPGGTEPSPRSWAIYNKGTKEVLLFYGDREIPSHPLSPGQIMVSDDSGGLGNKISAIVTEGSASLVVTIRGNFEEKDEEMTAPLVVIPFAPTGSNRPPKISDQVFTNTVTVLGQEQVDGLLDSDDFLAGWKFFVLASFEPGQSYNFKIKVEGPVAQNYLQWPIRVHALSIFKGIHLLTQVICNQIDPGQVNLKNQAWRVKERLVIIDSGASEFTLVPDWSKMVFGFWAKDSRIGYENGLVWNFDNNEFTILGF